MLSIEDNERVTRTGKGTPGGSLLRQYWQPVAMSSELGSRAPLPVQILGERLVLFRDDTGKPGLVGQHCPHRGADLSYGRLEGGGLRCLYHGWLFDRTGQCREQPAEPKDRQWAHRVKHLAYPVQERGGLVFAFLGEGEPPLLPEYEGLMADDAHRFIWKFRERCNWLQGLEGDIDPFHLSFLHRSLQNKPNPAANDSAGPQGTARTFFEFYAKGTPRLEVEFTDFGVRIFTIRELGEEAYLRVTNYVMPNSAAVAGTSGDDGYLMIWHVPIDDHHHTKYMVNFQRSRPIDQEAYQRAYEAHVIPNSDLQSYRNKENRYLQDREQMDSEWYSGLGEAFSLHDTFVTEGMGPVYDRSQEHLGYSDRAIIAARKMLLAGIADMEAGKAPAFQLRSADEAAVPELVVRSLLAPDKDRYQDALHLPAAAE